MNLHVRLNRQGEGFTCKLKYAILNIYMKFRRQLQELTCSVLWKRGWGGH